MVKALGKSEEEVVVKEEKGVGDNEIVLKVGNGRREQQGDKLMKPSSPNQNIFSCGQKDKQIQSAKDELGEVREENEKLRMHLNKILKDYHSLQMQYYDIVEQEAAMESTNKAGTREETEESELVSLSLGRTSIDPTRKDENPRKNKEHQEVDKGRLSLGLDCKFEGFKTRLISETLLKRSAESCKVLKTMKSENNEVSGLNPTKKARVSVRVQCDTPMINDGCQWRKYGQKIAKGNPCPRAYYRCTVGASCPVRKQVQRCAEDMSILITTYEGTHNHPLPISATAMASTTSAAASMLLSGSSTSTSGPNPTPSNISKQFFLPNSTSVSYSPSHPTVILDLTSSSSSHKIASNFISSNPRFSSTNLNFTSLESNPLPIPCSKGLQNFESRKPQEDHYQPFIHKGNPNPSYPTPPLPPDSISAATKAITSDPSFQSALAAALTSLIGTGGNGGGSLEYQGGEKCSSSYLNGSTNLLENSQPRSLMFVQPSFPFSTSNGKSTSPGDRDHMI